MCHSDKLLIKEVKAYWDLWEKYTSLAFTRTHEKNCSVKMPVQCSIYIFCLFRLIEKNPTQN